MNATAIILARAGSVGVPGKNVAEVAGRPCIAWTIEAARLAERVGRVVVSSDDAYALEIARRTECEVVERPADLASSTATVDDAARHAFTAIGEPAGPVVLLYANVPVRPAGLIDRALETLERTGADSVQSYAPVGKHHPWWTARLDASTGSVRPWEGEVLNHGCWRRQDLPSAFVPDGGVIALRPEALMLRVGAEAGPHAFFGRDRRGVVSGGAVVDVDEALDLAVATAILSEPRPSGSGSGAPAVGTPLAYFISFRTYGSWLHGDARGSVDRRHATPGDEFVGPHAGREERARSRLKGQPVVLTPQQRDVVERAIEGVCEHKGWDLLALNARTNHVHAVARVDGSAEAAMNAFKAWATRRLGEAGVRPGGPDGPVWSRHGSTRWLWENEGVSRACRYVIEGQDGGGPGPLPHGRGSEAAP